VIRLEKNIDSFDLYFKGWKVFSHSNEQQCFEIGIGIGKFRQSHASFKVREYVLERIRFSRWEVLNESNEQVIIQFSNNIHTLVVEFFLTDDKLLISPRCENGSINRLWMRINADEDEAIYGCGEQFSELNLRGSIIPIWVEDASPGSRKDYTYYPQPNFISSKNYFCHVETSYYSEFNFKNEREHLLYIWDVPEKIYIGKYDTILDTVKRLNVYLGLQSLIPEWCYEGICLGIQGGPQIVNEKIERARSSDVKVSAVWCQDWQGIRYTSFGKQLFWDWKFEENIYPNLPEYIKSLNSQGIQFLGYINSMLAIEGSLYKEASQ
jgi:alpha-glucosidase